MDSTLRIIRFLKLIFVAKLRWINKKKKENFYCKTR